MISIPRLWISSDGQVLNCDDIDLSHASIVVEYAETFGLSAIAPQLESMHHADDFDFDHVIALAEAAGWTRTSRDASGASGLAISSADPHSAAAAARHLELHHGIFAETIDVEISELSVPVLTQHHYRIADRHVAPFVRHGRLPVPFSVGRLAVVPLHPVPSPTMLRLATEPTSGASM